MPLVTQRSNAKEAIAIYGGAGTGKSRLAAAAMRADPKRYGPNAFYLCIDPGSAKMNSILKADRENLIPVIMGSMDKDGYDPYVELCSLADPKSPIRLEFPDVKTIIIDTLTKASRDILQAGANSGKFSEKNIVIEGKGPHKLALPMMGDYGMAQQCTLNALRLYETSGLNVIVLHHEGVWEPDNNSSMPAFGGPLGAGKGSIDVLAGWYDNLIRLEIKQEKKGDVARTVYRAYTEPKGPWRAKLRMSSEKNPVPVIELNPDPINFWQKLDEVM